jgi:hypothetical protein
MIIRLLRGLGQAVFHVMFGVFALAASAAAQGVPNQGAPNQAVPNQVVQNQGVQNPPASNPAPGSSPVCVRLEGQLAAIGNGAGDAGRADQIKRAEDAVAKQQADLDRTVAQGHRQGCEGQGFFSLFSGLSPQCGPITSQIQQMRGNLDRSMSDLEQLKSGTTDQDGQRRAVIGELAQNNCGQQYTAAANAAGPRGFFDALFSGGTILNPGGDGAPSGTYQTVCVRTCDGYYFPISYSTVPTRFADDQRSCQRLCPATEVALYSYHNPGEAIDQAVSLNGQPYTALPNAYHYRKEFTPACSCRRPGQSWGDALKDADDSSTLESGDIVVTDKTAKTLSQAPQAPGKPPLKNGAAGQQNGTTTAAAPAATAANANPAKNAVRTVGPPFVAGQ